MSDYVETNNPTIAPVPPSMPENKRETVVAPESRLPRISWGAIVAGLVVTLSISWLFHLLGIAIGVSIEDYSNTVALEDGVAGGAAVWLVISWLLSFFIGSLVTARLAGVFDDFTGMLHGLVLWGVGTLVAVYLGYVGISTILRTGTQAVSTTARGVQQIGSNIGTDVHSSMNQAGVGIANMVDSQMVNQLQNKLTESAIATAADMNEQLSKKDIRTAINELDSRTLRRLTQDLLDDDQDGAAELLAENTDLSEQDAEALINSSYKALEEQFGNPENRESLAGDLKNQLGRGIDSYVASLDAQGGPEVTADDVRTAVDRLDSDTMYAITTRLVQGDTAGAKRVLTSNTNLSRAQVDDIYEGASESVESEIEAYKAELNDAAEVATTYAQEVLWLTFAGSALALAVSLGGGWLGADSARRIHAVTVT